MKAIFKSAVAATVAMAAAVSAHASGTATQAPPALDPAAQAVLDCHAQYAKQFAAAVRDASATEIATGAQSRCKAQMDAYARHALEVAKEDAQTMPFAEKHQAEMVRDLKAYAFSFTVDSVLKARAMF